MTLEVRAISANTNTADAVGDGGQPAAERPWIDRSAYAQLPDQRAVIDLLQQKGGYLPASTRVDLVEAFGVIPRDRREDFRAHLEAWLDGRLGWSNLALRFEIASQTGYLFIDKQLATVSQPSLRDPDDTRRWSINEMQILRRDLGALPPSLRNLSALRFIERDQDSRVEGDSATGHYSGASRMIKIYDFDMGLGIANTFTGGLATRLLFAHEFGHAVQASDEALSQRWRAHWERYGGPSEYGSSNDGEGFAEAFWIFSHNPGYLKRNAPETYEFMRREYGDSLEPLNNPLAAFAMWVLWNKIDGARKKP